MSQNDSYDDILLGEFIVDALDIINDIEEICLAITKNSQHFFESKRDLMQKIHSLKGASGMFGLHEIEGSMHKIEHSITQLKNDDLLSDSHIDQLFSGIDLARKVLNLDSEQNLGITQEVEQDENVQNSDSETLLFIGESELLSEIKLKSPRLAIIICQTMGEAINFLEKETVKAIIIDPKASRGINYLQLREYFLTRKKIPTLLLDKNKSYLNLLEDEHISAPTDIKKEDIKKSYL